MFRKYKMMQIFLTRSVNVIFSQHGQTTSATVGYFPSVWIESNVHVYAWGWKKYPWTSDMDSTWDFCSTDPYFAFINELIKMKKTPVLLFLMQCSTLKIKQCNLNYSLLCALNC